MTAPAPTAGGITGGVLTTHPKESDMAPVLIVPADLRCEQIRGPELDAEMRRHSEDVQREIERRLMSGAWTCGLSTQPDVPRLPFYGIKCSPFC